MTPTEAKTRVRDDVERLVSTLVDVSHQIHGRPELCFEEHFAHDLLTGVLEDAGLEVHRSAYGLDTAFEARAGRGAGPHVAIVCEYDALPDLGHGCGHNIIGSAGLGAGLAAARVVDELDGRLSIIGTPAEEGGGGKELMARAGAFDDVDAAIMVHPANHDLQTMYTLANHALDVEYRGRSAHAAAAPHEGVNALDAAVLGYNNVAALRQHIRSDERVHGIFTDGGAKPNIVPSTAASSWYVRSPSIASLEPLKDRVVRCLRAGADAAGCEMTLTWGQVAYTEMNDNQALLDLYVANAEATGRRPEPARASTRVVGSTDMGNVSLRLPAIHPMIKVAPSDVPIHTPEFAVHARSEAGDRAVLDGAAAMAMTVVDCWSDPTAMTRIREGFDRGAD